MRISVLLEHLGTWGGSEEYVRQVGTGLLARGHEVRFCYEHDAPARGEAWESFVRSVASERIPGDGSDRTRWLKQHAHSWRPDVVFVNNVALSADAVADLDGTVPFVRFVHDFRPVCMRISRVLPLPRKNCSRSLGFGCLLHGCSVGPSRGSRFPVSWNDLGRRLEDRDGCLRMERILVASDFMRSVLLSNGFEGSRVHRIGLFCPTTVPLEPPALPSPERLLYLGQVQRFKGLPVLLEAMRHLPESVTLNVAGDGPWLARCRAMSLTFGLADRVRFHGWVDRERLPSLMEDAGMLVLPSVWNEPFGLAGLEAMAFGRPVVAFDVGGVSDWLEDGRSGVLVDRVDAGSLAGAIASLCADPARASAMGHHGHQRVMESYLLTHHLDRLEQELTSSGAALEEATSLPSA